jgi:hypothetical protein
LGRRNGGEIEYLRSRKTPSPAEGVLRMVQSSFFIDFVSRIDAIPFLVGFRFKVLSPAFAWSYMVLLAIFHAEGLIPRNLFTA